MTFGSRATVSSAGPRPPRRKGVDLPIASGLDLETLGWVLESSGERKNEFFLSRLGNENIFWACLGNKISDLQETAPSVGRSEKLRSFWSGAEIFFSGQNY